MEGSPRARRAYSALMTVTALVSFGGLVYPLYVIRPFRHQGARELALALAVLQVRRIAEIVCAVLALAGLAWYWQAERQRSRRIWAAVAAVFVCAFAVLTRVNVYELMFHPDAHPVFAAAAQVKLDPDDKVLAVKLGGSSRAYPIRTIAYHHIINDVVGQEPIVATY
jgi:hypothetical protein